MRLTPWICGCIFLRMKSSMNLAMKLLLSGMKLIFHMQFEDQWLLGRSFLKYYPFEAVKHNRPLYAHIFFVRSGYPPDPNDPNYLPLATFWKDTLQNCLFHHY